MLKKSMKWIATLVALLMVFSFVALFAACGDSNESGDDPTENPTENPTESESVDKWWVGKEWGTIEYQLVTYCIGHSEWGLLSLYSDGTVQAYGRMIQDLSNYGYTGYQITRTFLYGNWSIEEDSWGMETMYINYKYIEDYDYNYGDYKDTSATNLLTGEEVATGRTYEKTMSTVKGNDGKFAFNNITIPMYMPQYGMLYDECSTDSDWTYFLDSSDFVEMGVDSLDDMDAFFDGMDEKRSSSTEEESVEVVVSMRDSTDAYTAYLYSDGTGKINDGFYFTSNAIWWYDGTDFAIYNGTSAADVTDANKQTSSINDGTLSFTFSAAGGILETTYTCSVSDLAVNTIYKPST